MSTILTALRRLEHEQAAERTDLREAVTGPLPRPRRMGRVLALVSTVTVVSAAAAVGAFYFILRNDWMVEPARPDVAAAAAPAAPVPATAVDAVASGGAPVDLRAAVKEERREPTSRSPEPEVAGTVAPQPALATPVADVALHDRKPSQPVESDGLEQVAGAASESAPVVAAARTPAVSKAVRRPVERAPVVQIAQATPPVVAAPSTPTAQRAKDEADEDPPPWEERVRTRSEPSPEKLAPVVAPTKTPPVARVEAASPAAHSISDTSARSATSAESSDDSVDPVVATPSPAAERVSRVQVPDPVVERTFWHPVAERRSALVSEPGDSAIRIREGDRFGPLLVLEIKPSGVVFDHEGVQIQKRVGGR